MARHASTPRLLSWWQRLAIAVPVLLLAGVVTIAITQRDDTAAPSDADIAGAPVSQTTPPPTDGDHSDAIGADSDTTTSAGDEADTTDDETGRPEPRETGPADDQITPDEGSDSDESDPDESGPDGSGTDNTESPETIGPDSDDETGTADGPDSGNDDDETGPTTPPDDDTDPTEPPDETDTVTMGDAIAACRAEIGAGHVNKAVRTCADALVGTPVSQLQSNVADAVSQLGCLLSPLCRF
ncbi:ICP22 family protein [Solicola gregarius]|uniref:Uncharacterized protein n=1 Tax=Solicola gregarius TaxID=2908642 RepID=A0AA46TKE8_9ACTN|nr:hypothetical protein [Solicola gregarius]UYM06931.1 hypothetical protein L0C25_07605 [Solicola gregarius]